MTKPDTSFRINYKEELARSFVLIRQTISLLERLYKHNTENTQDHHVIEDVRRFLDKDSR